jgi:sulfide:quinone oxidoreductase
MMGSWLSAKPRFDFHSGKARESVGMGMASEPGSLGRRRFRVVIAGGGVAAIEGALALRELAADRVELTLATAASEFVYRPLAVMRPFQAHPSYRLELAGVARDLDATLVGADAVAVDSDQHQLLLSTGRRLGYDALLVAIGARAEAVLGGGTLTPWDWGEGHAYRSLLGALTGGRARRVVFIVPAGLTWPLPLYELALLTSTYIRERAIGGASLTIVTAERAPLEDFGAEASAAVAALLASRKIAIKTGHDTDAVEAGVVRTAQGGAIAADATVALPVIQPHPLPGISTDTAGFIAVDAYCRVVGSRDVFAAGDCTNLPLKQGGLGAQQADVAAAGIAALAGAKVAPTPLRPNLEAVLLTGEAPLHLDASGARPITDRNKATDRERQEKLFARHLTPFLAATTTPPPFLDT